MARRGRRNPLWHPPADRPAPGGHHQPWRNQNCSCRFLPNRAIPPNLFERQALENVSGRLEIIAPGRRAGASRSPTNMAGRGTEHQSSVATAITWPPPQNLREVLRPACGVRRRATVPRSHCRGRHCGVAFGSKPCRPGPCPQRAPRHSRLYPRPSPTATEQSLVESWQGTVQALGRSGPSRCLNSKTASPRRPRRPPPTTPRSRACRQLITRGAGRITMGVVQEEEELVRQAGGPCT